jgi:DNA polymerase-3 subunit delta
MQIKPDQLPSRLKQNTLPMIWIAGDDPLLVQESCDTVRQFARAQGFSEREVLDAGANFKWDHLLASGNSLSLFAERKLIDLRLTGAKLDEDARSALEAYLSNPNPDNLLLLTTGKIEKQAQSTKWFMKLESQALFVPIWPVSERDLPQWIKQRLQQHGLTADADAIQVLVERVEGNLLAASQEIEKLRLLATSTHLDAQSVMEAVVDNSRFTVFALTDACLGGNSGRALNILNHLQAEGEECLFILNMLCREIRTLAGIKTDVDHGLNPHSAMQTRGVWQNRQTLVSGALERHSQGSLQKLLDRARIVDQSVKGLLENRPWDELASVTLGLSNPRLLVGVV